jgi:hypothetical protein
LVVFPGVRPHGPSRFHPCANGCRCCLARQQRVTPAGSGARPEAYRVWRVNAGEGRCPLDIVRVMDPGHYDAPQSPAYPATLMPPLGLQANATWLGENEWVAPVFELVNTSVRKQCGTKHGWLTHAVSHALNSARRSA